MPKEPKTKSVATGKDGTTKSYRELLAQHAPDPKKVISELTKRNHLMPSAFLINGEIHIL